MNQPIKIVYYGTSDFAVASLESLLLKGYNIQAVVTAPDKPSGRGLKISHSPVYNFAKKRNLNILQPENLKDENFLDTLKKLNPDLQIVVAFRMLPAQVWKLPVYGTFNLHASLLPQYRGAAPINRAIMNGETKTGVTTFFINEKIDTGNIILQEEVGICPDENAGELHDRLMHTGANLVIKTVEIIESKNTNAIPQNSIVTNDLLKTAPKIFKEDCNIRWNSTVNEVYNHVRGLSPYPAATAEIISPDGKPYYIKVFICSKRKEQHTYQPGKIITNGITHITVAVTDGFIDLEEIQLQAKKKMRIPEFLRGFPMNERWSTKLI